MRQKRKIEQQPHENTKQRKTKNETMATTIQVAISSPMTLRRDHKNRLSSLQEDPISSSSGLSRQNLPNNNDRVVRGTTEICCDGDFFVGLTQGRTISPSPSTMKPSSTDVSNVALLVSSPRDTIRPKNMIPRNTTPRWQEPNHGHPRNHHHHQNPARPRPTLLSSMRARSAGNLHYTKSPTPNTKPICLSKKNKLKEWAQKKDTFSTPQKKKKEDEEAAQHHHPPMMPARSSSPQQDNACFSNDNYAVNGTKKYSNPNDVLTKKPRQSSLTSHRKPHQPMLCPPDGEENNQHKIRHQAGDNQPSKPRSSSRMIAAMAQKEGPSSSKRPALTRANSAFCVLEDTHISERNVSPVSRREDFSSTTRLVGLRKPQSIYRPDDNDPSQKDPHHCPSTPQPHGDHESRSHNRMSHIANNTRTDKPSSRSDDGTPKRPLRRRTNADEIYYPTPSSESTPFRCDNRKLPLSDLQKEHRLPSIPPRTRSNEGLKAATYHHHSNFSSTTDDQKEPTKNKRPGMQQRSSSLKHFFGKSASSSPCSDLNNTLHSEKAVASPTLTPPSPVFQKQQGSSKSMLKKLGKLSGHKKSSSSRHLSCSSTAEEESLETDVGASKAADSDDGSSAVKKKAPPSRGLHKGSGSLRNLLKGSNKSHKKDKADTTITQSDHATIHANQSSSSLNVSCHESGLPRGREMITRTRSPTTKNHHWSSPRKQTRITTSEQRQQQGRQTTTTMSLTGVGHRPSSKRNLLSASDHSPLSPKAALDKELPASSTSSGRRVFRCRNKNQKHHSTTANNIENGGCLEETHDSSHSHVGKKKTKRFQQLLSKRAKPTRTKSDDLEFMMISAASAAEYTTCIQEGKEGKGRRSRRHTATSTAKTTRTPPVRSKSEDGKHMETRSSSFQPRAKRRSEEAANTSHAQHEEMNKVGNDDVVVDDDDHSLSLEGAFDAQPIQGVSMSQLEMRKKPPIQGDNDDDSIALEPEKPTSGILAGLWSSFNGSFRNDDDESDDESTCLLNDIPDETKAKKKKRTPSSQKGRSMMSSSMPDLDTGDMFLSPYNAQTARIGKSVKGGVKANTSSPRDAGDDEGSLSSADDSNDPEKPSSGIIAGLWNSLSSFQSLPDDDLYNGNDEGNGGGDEDDVVGWNASKSSKTSWSSVGKDKQQSSSLPPRPQSKRGGTSDPSPVVVKKAVETAGGLITGIIDTLYDSLMDENNNSDDNSDDDDHGYGAMPNERMSKLDKKINKLAGLS